MSVDTVSTFLAVGAIVIGAVVVVVGTVALVARISPTGGGMLENLRLTVAGRGLWLAAAMATIATAGSLYYSEVAGFIPCQLCWYQRIAMYPLVVILGIAAFRRDLAVRRYVIPVATIGAAISVYHYLLQHFPDLDSGVCGSVIGAPCTAAWVWKFEFVSIPFMALVSFAAIVAALALDRRQVPSDQAANQEQP